MKHALANAAEIPPGTARAYQIDGTDVLICNVDGTFFAMEDVCTHDGGQLDQGTLEGRCIVCPRHGAMFDVETGAALTLPAVMPIQTFGVALENGRVVVDL